MSSFVRAILQKEFVFSFDHNTKSTWWNLLLNIATMPVITSASEGNILKSFECSLRREAIDHVGISDQNQVQPTTTPPSARGHTELSASTL